MRYEPRRHDVEPHGIGEDIDPVSGLPAEARLVHPHQATKTYLCPGCNQEVARGMGHVVVVPAEAPDLRRHWHRPCWLNRHRRQPGR